MATRQMKALKDMKYGTRMLKAGDPVEMSGPDARLYAALGAVRPVRASRVAEAPPVTPPPAADTAPTTKRKPAARKKAAKKAK